MDHISAESLALSWRGGQDGQEPWPRNRTLYELLRAAVLDGSLPAGARLPATRELARELALSRNTVTHAYDKLIAEGYRAVATARCA